MFIKPETKLPPLARRRWLTYICGEHIEQYTVSLLVEYLLYSEVLPILKSTALCYLENICPIMLQRVILRAIFLRV